MDQTEQPFRIGRYRPIYLWAGPGTVRMNRLKFMNQAVDEEVHLEAHTPQGAQRVVGELFCNWVHLTYNWGFPPEIEIEDWQSFEQAARAYHQAGSPVFAYIQTSNCVIDGSFRNKKWYALDARGRMVHYYTGRYMVCPQNEEWRAHLTTVIAGAIQRGADGIFFDNLWYGEQPFSLFSAWLGGAGCYCPACQQKYFEHSGEKIPKRIQPGEVRSDAYIRWRANQLSRLVEDLAAHARAIKQDVVISANDYDPVPRPSYLVFGIDLQRLSHVQDVMMIENFSLPRWDAVPVPRLANNALTVRLVRPALREGIHLSMLSYDTGIGFDGVYPLRRYLQGMAEAAACGCSTTIKGTEYFDGSKHTLLTEERYGNERRAIGEFNRWLKENANLYDPPAEAIAPIGLLLPGDALWQNWHSLAPLLLGAAQTLTAAGIPWRAINPGQAIQGLTALLTFEEGYPGEFSHSRIRRIFVPDLNGWVPRQASLTARSTLVNRLVSAGAHWLLNQYFSSRVARRWMDRLGMARLVTQTPYFVLPASQAREALLAALPEGEIFPRVKARQPVLVEVLRRPQGIQVHLMNYADQPQSVQVIFSSAVDGVMVSPQADLQGWRFSGKEIEFFMDIYTVLTLDDNTL